MATKPVHMRNGLASAKPTLTVGEFYYATDTNTLYMGNPGGTELSLNIPIPLSYLDTDTSLAADSDVKVASQKAVKAYADAITTSLSGYVAKSLYDANTILAANSDNTPAALTIAASRIIGRKASGDISAMTAAETKAVLGTVGDVFSIVVQIPGSQYVADAIRYIDIPFASTLTRIYSQLGTAGSGGVVTYDVRDADSTILNADISIADGATTTDTTSFADDTFSQFERLYIDCNTATSPSANLQMTFFFTKTA